MTSRIQTAKLRADRTKRGLLVVATAGFLAVMLLARDSHAGSSHAVTVAPQAGRAAASASGLGSSSSGSFGAPTGPPQVQTSVS